MPPKFRPAYIIALPEQAFGGGGLGLGDVEADLSGGVPATSDRIVILPHVESFVHEPRPSAVLTLTQDSFVIDGHPSGVRVEDIMLVGNTQWPEPKSLARDTSNFPESESYAQLRLVSAALREALTTARRTIYFYAVDEGVYLECMPVRMRFPRQKPNRTGSRYELTLQGLRPIMALNLFDAWPADIKPQTSSHWYDSLAAAYSTCKQALATVKDYYDRGIEYVSTPFIWANKALGEVESLLDEIDDMQASLSNLLHQPKYLADRCARLAAQAQSVAQQAKQGIWDFTFDRALGFAGYDGPESADEVLATGTPTDVQNRALEAQLDGVQLALRTLHVRARVAAGQTNIVERYWTVTRFDSLETIAAAVYAAPGRAAEIAGANRLRYPWITLTGERGTAKPGDRIRIPGNVTGTLQTVPTGDEATADAAIYGRDFRLDARGDLYRVGADDDVDFAMVEGVDNATQAIKQRTATVRGSNRCFPVYGIPASIGSGNLDDSYAAYLVAITNGLLQDDRVLSVVQLSASDDGDGWHWNGLINLVTGLQLPGTGVAA